MHHCSTCHNALEAERLRCSACGLAYEGRFGLARLARLGPAEQDLAERVLLAAGNLKEVAAALEVSYPTLRKRLDALILRLQGLRDEDEARTRALLDEVEAGTRSAEEAARLIKEMNGGA
jgi:hypothetical protein